MTAKEKASRGRGAGCCTRLWRSTRRPSWVSPRPSLLRRTKYDAGSFAAVCDTQTLPCIGINQSARTLWVVCIHLYSTAPTSMSPAVAIVRPRRSVHVRKASAPSVLPALLKVAAPRPLCLRADRASSNRPSTNKRRVLGACPGTK